MLQEAEAQKDFGAGGRPPVVAPFVIYNGAAAWNAATDLAEWIAPDAVAALDTLLGLQMRRRYILVDLKGLGQESGIPPPEWFSVLAEWESARWTEDADRLAASQHTGRTKTMIRYEETYLAAQLRKRDVAGELSRLFDGLTDPDRIEALAGAVIECETGAEFIARARRASA